MRLSSCWGAEGAPPLTASPAARTLSPTLKWLLLAPTGDGLTVPRTPLWPLPRLGDAPLYQEQGGSRASLGRTPPRQPRGCHSGLLSSSPYDASRQGYKDWTFMSTHFWDENPNGTWTLRLENKGDAYNTGGWPGPQGSEPHSRGSPRARSFFLLPSPTSISNLLACPLPAPPGCEPSFSAGPRLFVLRVFLASTQPGRGHGLLSPT